MSDYRELVSILKEILTNRFYPKPEFIRGLLGDGRGNILVPERPDFNYVRFNRSSTETFEIFNKEVNQPVDGWPVLIGELPWQPGLTQIVGTDWAAYEQAGWGNTDASMQAHAPTHEWQDSIVGSDPVNVYLRALTPLRTYGQGSGSTQVFVAPYTYDWTGSAVTWPGVPPVSLSAATPATGTMRYMGVYLNPPTNTIGLVTGNTTIFTDAIEPSRPEFPSNVFPSAFVRLYGGQATTTELDIKDARRLFHTNLMFTGTSSIGGSPDASETVKGIAELATQAETDAGTDDARIVTPLKLANTSLIERAYQSTPYNGSIAVWQHGTSFAAVADGDYSADGWKYRKTAGVMVHTISQSSDVPTVAQAGILATYSLLVDCTTIDASIAAGDLCTIGTRIEGFDFVQIAQRTFTCSFWVKATKTGIYCISFRNSGADRSYVAEFTINTTATWEYKTVTIAASPGAGTWDYVAGLGLSVEICLAGGSNYNTTAGAWQTGSFLNTTNQVNGCDNTANDFRIALFDIVPGSYDRPFPVEDYQKKLARCQRYGYTVISGGANTYIGVGQAYTTTRALFTLVNPVPLRIAASAISISAAGDFTVLLAGGTTQTVTGLTYNSATLLTTTVDAQVAANLVAGNASFLLNGNSNARIYVFVNL